MQIWRGVIYALVLAGAIGFATTAHAQGLTDMKKGEGGSAVQGSAGPSGSSDAASDLERCDKPLGAMAVVEPQDQQSNCFLVVERGLGMKNMMSVETSKGGGWVKKVLVTR